ncbi:MAG: transglycosylase SLT domain-containing protein [Lentimicrobium sp.]|nr:transglycosylase SLT domain-containing protein [Lentimicrobium sp.]
MKKNIITYIYASIILIVLPLIFLRFTETRYDYDKQYKEKFTAHTFALSVDIPEKLEFAGENVPLDFYYVRESLDRELLVNTYWHSNTLLLLKRAGRFFPLIEPILKKNGIPDDFKYLALIESGLMNVVSPSNAAGLWQFLDKTGQQFGLEVTDQVDERYHYSKSTEAACRYLNDAYKKYRNWTLSAASYNAGQGRISKETEKQKTNNYYDLYLNQETSRYIYRVLALKLIYENPADYGFYLRKKDIYPPVPTKSIKVDTTITDLVKFALDYEVPYKVLKEFNPWLRTDQLKVAPGKNYTIELPETSWLKYSKLQDKIEDGNSIFNYKDSTFGQKNNSREKSE